ncbi:MAG: urease accessory protein UreD [Gammaproteobacteria bacterium]|jgi:urease accessory protein
MLNSVRTQNQTETAGWQARLELVYAWRNDKTVIARRQHVGPLTVQRPFYPEQDVCHSYVLHPPGGVVGGDQLALHVAVEHRAHALVTTPASAKFYRSAGAAATQRLEFTVANEGVLEYLPQDTILFDACQVDTTTRVTLAATAKYAGWEILCQGRPASGEKFTAGQCRQAYELYREDRPLIIERTLLSGNSLLQTARWGLANYPVTGTFLVSDADEELMVVAREAVTTDSAMCSVSLINGVMVCRYLGWQGIEARDCFARIWEAIRPDWIGRQACRPRIWDT